MCCWTKGQPTTMASFAEAPPGDVAKGAKIFKTKCVEDEDGGSVDGTKTRERGRRRRWNQSGWRTDGPVQTTEVARGGKDPKRSVLTDARDDGAGARNATQQPQEKGTSRCVQHADDPNRPEKTGDGNEQTQTKESEIEC